MPQRPRPDARPEPCPTCCTGRVWWPAPIGYVAYCPWCERDAMCSAPDDVDHDAPTVAEPVLPVVRAGGP